MELSFNAVTFYTNIPICVNILCTYIRSETKHCNKNFKIVCWQIAAVLSGTNASKEGDTNA